jgi:hypothetical protein
MEGTRRGGRLLNNIKSKRRYCNLKEKALVCALWRIRFGRGYGPVVKTAYAVKSACTVTGKKGIKPFNL